MSENDDKVVPVAGINQHQKSNGFSGAARSSGEVWRYPEDVPSPHARKHGTPRRWTLRGFLALAIFALLAFWMGAAVAIGQERTVVSGDKAAFSVEDITDKGVPVGSWSLTVERTDVPQEGEK